MEDTPKAETKRRRLDASRAANLPAAACTSSSTSSPGALVLVWDLDETLLIFNSLHTGQWSAAHAGSDAALARRLAAKWQAAIFSLADSALRLQQVEEYDVCCLADISKFDDGASLESYDFLLDGFPHRPPQQAGSRKAGVAAADGSSDGRTPQKEQQEQQQQQEQAQPRTTPELPISSLDDINRQRLAYRYRDLSSRYSTGLGSLGSDAQRCKWQQLYEQTDSCTDGWLSHAASLLAECSAALASGDRPVRHVAVTSGQLVPSLAKLLLFQLDQFFSPGDVYSSRGSSKARCFDLVQQRFGDACSYVAIGDGKEEELAAAERGWPYLRVLLTNIGAYPASYVERLQPDASGSLGLPLPALTVEHVRAAAARAQRPTATST